MPGTQFREVHRRLRAIRLRADDAGREPTVRCTSLAGGSRPGVGFPARTSAPRGATSYPLAARRPSEGDLGLDEGAGAVCWWGMDRRGLDAATKRGGATDRAILSGEDSPAWHVARACTAVPAGGIICRV